MSLFRVRSIMLMGPIVALVCVLIGVYASGPLQIGCFVLGGISALAALILEFTLWRCPMCKAKLPRRGMLRIEECPHCYGKLDI
ncbi:MAG TPA: hypothetical protein DEQ02_04850 [Ruminococcaceae bacterium]|nr:hypothetical protein [Oscillospiraceae bacterium]